MQKESTPAKCPYCSNGCFAGMCTCKCHAFKECFCCKKMIEEKDTYSYFLGNPALKRTMTYCFICRPDLKQMRYPQCNHYKCNKCGAEWCDHTNIGTWEDEFLSKFTHKGDTGAIFNNYELASKCYPEQIIRIIKEFLN